MSISLLESVVILSFSAICVSAQIRVPRFGMATAAVSGSGSNSRDSAFIAGGTNFTDYYNTVNWITIRGEIYYDSSPFLLSEPRAYLAGAASCLYSNCFAFFAGGRNDAQVFNIVDVFDFANGGRSIKSISISRYNLAGVGITSSSLSLVAFGGGQNSSGHVSNLVEVYNLYSQDWRVYYLSLARTNLAAASLDNYGEMWFAGGIDASGNPSNVVDIFTFVSSGLLNQRIFYLSVPRGFLAASSFSYLMGYGAFIAFSGGIDNQNCTSNVVDIYEADVGWSVKQMFVGRCNHSSTMIYDKNSGSYARPNIFFIGGVTGTLNNYNITFTDSVEIYSVDSRQWFSTKMILPSSLLSAFTLYNSDPYSSTASIACASGGLSLFYRAIDTQNRFQTICGIGKILNIYSSQCSECSAGWYCEKFSNSLTPCPPGYYCSVGSTNIGPECPKGSYCPELSSSPIDCPGGSFCPNTTMSVSIPCYLGNYCPKNSIIQKICQGGYYCTTPSEQNYCVGGTYCPSGTITPIITPPGNYSNAYSEIPIPCQAGYSCPNPGTYSMNMQYCTLGSYCPVGTINEKLCPEGYFCSTSASISLCSPGYYCPIGSWYQNTCPDGKYCPNAGMSSALSCPPGNSCVYGTITPKPCPINTRPDDNAYCVPCDGNSYTEGPGSTKCIPKCTVLISNWSCLSSGERFGLVIIIIIFGILFPVSFIIIIKITYQRIQIIKAAELPVTLRRLIKMDDIKTIVQMKKTNTFETQQVSTSSDIMLEVISKEKDNLIQNK